MWSVVLEPLLFFVIWDRITAGIGGNISRILQGIVIIAMMSKYFNMHVNFRIQNLASKYYLNYIIYLSITIIAGLVGAVLGSYEAPVPYFTPDQSYSYVFRQHRRQLRMSSEAGGRF